MSKRLKICIIILTVLITITGCNGKQARWTINSSIDDLIKFSPSDINCMLETVDNVEILDEYILIIPDESKTSGNVTTGIASFQVNNKIYLFGHSIPERSGNLVIKADKSYESIEICNLMGKIISNSDNGVIAEKSANLREYASIPIAKTIHLGEALILERDEKGDICEYPINIIAFKEDENMFFYTSSELQLAKGMSGCPITQDDKLIGIHFGSDDNKKIGAGWIIWSLEIVQV